MTGPATDNQVGVDIILQQMGVAAANAITSGAELGDRVIAAAGLAEKFPVKPTTRVRMSRQERIPTLVLGGTGYVAGELLRLHRRASAPRARGGVSPTQARRAARERLSAPRAGLPGHAHSSASTRRSG